MQVEEYRAALKKTRNKLAEGPISPAQLARKLKISKPTAYSRIDALRELGCTIVEKSARVGKRGPKSKTYHLTAGDVPELARA